LLCFKNAWKEENKNESSKKKFTKMPFRVSFEQNNAQLASNIWTPDFRNYSERPKTKHLNTGIIHFPDKSVSGF
jgi:hypothetical protein